jgi:hypothetical protein
MFKRNRKQCVARTAALAARSPEEVKVDHLLEKQKRQKRAAKRNEKIKLITDVSESIRSIPSIEAIDLRTRDISNPLSDALIVTIKGVRHYVSLRSVRRGAASASS